MPALVLAGPSKAVRWRWLVMKMCSTWVCPARYYPLNILKRTSFKCHLLMGMVHNSNGTRLALLPPNSPRSPPLHGLFHLPRRDIHPHKPDPHSATLARQLRCLSRRPPDGETQRTSRHDREIRQGILRRQHDAGRLSGDLPLVPHPLLSHHLHQGQLDPVGHLHRFLPRQILSE